MGTGTLCETHRTGCSNLQPGIRHGQLPHELFLTTALAWQTVMGCRIRTEQGGGPRRYVGVRTSGESRSKHTPFTMLVGIGARGPDGVGRNAERSRGSVIHGGSWGCCWASDRGTAVDPQHAGGHHPLSPSNPAPASCTWPPSLVSPSPPWLRHTSSLHQTTLLCFFHAPALRRAIGNLPFHHSRWMMTTRIISYNVLSDALAVPKQHIACDAAHLESEARYQRLLQYCHAWIGGHWVSPEQVVAIAARCFPENGAGTSPAASAPILCLQEVSQAWLCRLRPWLEARHYHVVYRQYGWWGDGVMGVLLAVPLSSWRVVAMNLVTVGATLPAWPRPPFSKHGDGLAAGHDALLAGRRPLARALQCARAWWRKGLDTARHGKARVRRWLERISERGRTEAPAAPATLGLQETWRRARERRNATVMLHLEHRETREQVVVATYHMPCAFQNPVLMAIHAVALVQSVHAFARSAAAALADAGSLPRDSRGDVYVPYAIAGDFNIKPTEPVYAVLTAGGTATDILRAHGQSLPHDLQWDPALPVALVSAHVCSLGKEPAWTNSAVTPGTGGLFQETLDYMWLSPGVSVVETLPLPAARMPRDAKAPPSACGPVSDEHKEDVADGDAAAPCCGALPNAIHASDHVPIGVVCSWQGMHVSHAAMMAAGWQATEV